MNRQLGAQESAVPLPAVTQDGGAGDACAKRILIADDDSRARIDVAEILVGSGYAVTVSDKEGRAAHNKADQTFSTYLINVTASSFDGIEMVRRVRTHNPDAWIVAVSNGDQGLRPDVGLTLALIAGADEMLFRPTRADLLAAFSSGRNI
jgi:DNA-binding response OmpR family regulator